MAGGWALAGGSAPEYGRASADGAEPAGGRAPASSGRGAVGIGASISASLLVSTISSGLCPSCGGSGANAQSYTAVKGARGLPRGWAGGGAVCSAYGEGCRSYGGGGRTSAGGRRTYGGPGRE